MLRFLRWITFTADFEPTAVSESTFGVSDDDDGQMSPPGSCDAAQTQVVAAETLDVEAADDGCWSAEESNSDGDSLQPNANDENETVEKVFERMESQFGFRLECWQMFFQDVCSPIAREKNFEIERMTNGDRWMDGVDSFDGVERSDDPRRIMLLELSIGAYVNNSEYKVLVSMRDGEQVFLLEPDGYGHLDQDLSAAGVTEIPIRRTTLLAMAFYKGLEFESEMKVDSKAGQISSVPRTIENRILLLSVVAEVPSLAPTILKALTESRGQKQIELNSTICDKIKHAARKQLHYYSSLCDVLNSIELRLATPPDVAVETSDTVKLSVRVIYWQHPVAAAEISVKNPCSQRTSEEL